MDCFQFELIKHDSWERKEYFDHYFASVPCTYCMSFTLDITAIKKASRKLYPPILYSIAKVINCRREFRTAFNGSGQLGFFDKMIPCYTVFHKDTETFSTIWTEYIEDYKEFCTAYEKDGKLYGSVHHLEAKPNTPPNVFNVSMIPWESFDGFHLNLQKGFDYLLPIFTLGKYYEENGRLLIPFAVQVHHAVCDAYHVCRLKHEVQEILNQLPAEIACEI
nr:chloramphenicol acetyltransferase [uncultured bacterium]